MTDIRGRAGHASDPYLDEIIQQVIDWNAARPRSQQKEIGWSQIGGCRAYMGFRLDGAWPTDDTDAWAPVKGTALHAWMSELRREATSGSGRDVRFDVELSYGGIPGHADEVDVTANQLTDWKFIALRSAGLWDDPQVLEEKFVQPMGYAAGLVSAGILRAGGLRVRLMLAPVDGRFADWRTYVRDFDPAVADAAVGRYREVERARAEGRALPKDMPLHFCRNWCEFCTACRGGEAETRELPQITDPQLAAAIERYGEAHEARSNAEKVMRELRPLLYGLRGQARGWRISTGSAGYSERPDLEQIRADYAASGLLLPIRRELQDGQLRVSRIRAD